MSELLVISSSHAAALVSFASSLGISPNKCLAEAIEDWLNIVAPARLEETISQPDKPSNVIKFPLQQEDGLIECRQNFVQSSA